MTKRRKLDKVGAGMGFVMRKIDRLPQTLGDKLRALRRGQAISLDMLEETTHIQRRYLEALERGRYEELPEPIYSRNFIKAYARALGADWQYFLELYDEESGRVDLLAPHRLPRMRASKTRFFVLSKLLRMGLLSFLALGIVSYLGWQIKGMIQAPTVVLTSPTDGLSSPSAMITVKGFVEEGEVTLRINGEPTAINPDRSFTTDVDLTRGMNVITVEAERRYSKTSKIERRVVFDGFPEEKGISQVSFR